MMAAAMLPVLAALGSAVDFGRIYLVRSQMQAGVDSAALAGARSFSNTSTGDAGRDRQVELYFQENFPSGYMGSPDVMPEPTFEVINEVNVTTVTASVDVPMTFMKIFGFTTQHIEVTARAELQPRPLEVMVVLDNTGSMQTKDVGAGSRMDALKNAMYTFIDTLHQGSFRRDELAMGFVTYNVTTNVGAILRSHGVAVQGVDGYTNIEAYTGPASNRADPLGWLGCVDDDETVRDLSSSPSTFEAGAWDITRSLPGEFVSGVEHPAVQPYHYAPSALLKTAAYTYSTTPRLPADFLPTHEQSNTSDSRKNNHYLLSPSGNMALGQTLANKPIYRKHFYDFYIGLNYDKTSITDDVITKPDGSYYDPTKDGDNFIVQYSRIPYLTQTKYWAQPNAKYGYPITAPHRSGYTLKMPSPNWQCPEPAMMIEYGRNKSEYDDYITYDNYPVMPASGTLHHIGFLWGYRILTRDDVFTRDNPIPEQKPLRALIFMTDGETSVGSDAFWYGAYGRLADKRITNTATASSFQTQIMRRFAKVCEAAKRDDIAVYIVSLKASVGEFSTCAGNRYYRTTDAETINNAFEQIAVDLVDLHLTQ